jgi:hypothetical protein
VVNGDQSADPVPRTAPERAAPWKWPLALLPAGKLLVQLAVLPGYGFFRDEFYYVACSERLDWGYVDHPPFSVLLLRGVRLLLGDSIWAIRLLPALAGAATVLLVGAIARALGGGAFAQALAMLAALAAPVYLGTHHIYSMNALDVLFWAAAASLLVAIARAASPRLWLALGVVLGLGLQNKISVLWLGLGLLVGLLATPLRRELRTPWPWAAGLIATALFLPHVLWQVANDWPTLEFIRNATQQKMAPVAPLDFVASQLRVMNVVSAPVWIAGLAWLLGARAARPFRALGWAYLVVFAILVASRSSRAGYLAPAYTWLFAAGGAALEPLVERAGWSWLRPLALGLLALGGAARAPFAIPLLPVGSYIAYARALGVTPSTAEQKELAALPQWYADMHGWEEIVATVAAVQRRLPPEQRARAVVFAPDYGVAGAVDFLGRERGLRAISGHNNYWLWGPQGASGEVVLVVGGDAEEHREFCGRVERAATIECGHCMPYENHNPVFVCTEPKLPLATLWPRLKHYD